MKGLYTILLLIVSNVFMTFAWYGQLKLLEIVPSSKDWPLFLVILMSWGVALFEYSFMIPANRIGAMQNGGPFNLIQLKVFVAKKGKMHDICGMKKHYCKNKKERT